MPVVYLGFPPKASQTAGLHTSEFTTFRTLEDTYSTDTVSPNAPGAHQGEATGKWVDRGDKQATFCQVRSSCQVNLM